MQITVAKFSDKWSAAHNQYIYQLLSSWSFGGSYNPNDKFGLSGNVHGDNHGNNGYDIGGSYHPNDHWNFNGHVFGSDHGNVGGGVGLTYKWKK